MMRRAYQTDLSNAEWALIEPHLPAPRAPGRPRLHPLRERSLTPSSTRKERLRLATSTTRISTLAHRLPLLQSLAVGWNMGKDALRSAPAGAGAHEARSSA